MRSRPAILIGLLFLAGCAHSIAPPSPLPESLQQQLGNLGVVARSQEEEKALQIPGSGRLCAIGRGAGLGTLIGAGSGAQGGPLAFFAIPAGAALGLVGGTLYGAAASESWREADTTFRSIVAELELNRTLPDHLVDFSRSHDFEVKSLPAVPPQGPGEQACYAAARRDGIDTVIEIQDLTIHMVPAEFLVNPQRGLTLSARVRLIRTGDEAVVDDRTVIDQLGPALALDEWTANGAARFRQEVQQASKRLAERIITDYWMLYPFPEQVTSNGLFSMHLKGLRPLYPGERIHRPNTFNKEKDIRAKYDLDAFPGTISEPFPLEFRMLAQRVDSLQPTMTWEPEKGSQVTYDLKIWRSGRLGPDVLVYDRTNLEQASHKLETALEPSTLYYWSIRAHFREGGRERITDWSRRSVTTSVAAKVLTAGIASLLPIPVDEGFYVFITPPLPSQSSPPAASESRSPPL